MSKGFSTVVGAVLVMLILTVIYTSYQVYGVPAYCKNYENSLFAKLESDVLKLVSEEKDLVTTGKAKTVCLHLGGVYPPIPFFSTPNGFSGSVVTYPAYVEIDNVNVTSVTSLGLPNPYGVINPTLKIFGSNLAVIPQYNYLKVPTIRIEYGVVAVGTIPLSKFITNDTIFIPLFRGNLSLGGDVACIIHLYPVSAGGNGVIISNYTAGNITIKILSQLPVSFWRSVVPSWVYVSTQNVNNTTYIVFQLPPKRYKLIMGMAGLEESGRLPPDYLYPVSPISQTSPCGIIVQARDVLNNPVPGVKVTFTSTSATLSTLSNLTLVSGNTIAVMTNEKGYASVTATSGYTSIVKVYLSDRSALQPYEVGFIVSG